MRHVTLVSRILVLFLAIYAFGYAYSEQPAVAQDDPPPAPVVEESAKMAYQPPVDADTLDDFMPVQATEISISAPNRTVENFSEESIAQLDADPTQPAAQIDKATITASSETVFNVNNGELGIVIESGTVTDTSTLSLSSLVVREPSLTQTTSIDAATMMTFQLELEDATGTEIEEFNKPVRLVVDLRTYGIDLDAVGGRFYLAYEDEENPGEWREVDIESYGRDGLISTETDHFSNWSAGWRPEAWALEWKPPVTNEFTGAASYGYGFNIPPGRAGLQPALSLSYSSASLRGAIRQTSMGTVASGWSLSDISITRTKIENGASWWNFYDEFRLTMSGVGGRLVHQGQANGGELYFVEDNPQIRVYNYGGNSWGENQTGNSYWIVKDGSGSQYRLGYTTNAVSYQGVDSLDAGSGYDAVDIIAWHIDTITDSSGNQINYEYTRPGRFESWGFWCPWGGNCAWNVSTFNSQVTEISYNFNDRITNLPASNTVARLRDSAAAGSRITFAYDANDGDRLATVNVYHGNFPHPSRRYVIEAVTVQVSGSNSL